MLGTVSLHLFHSTILPKISILAIQFIGLQILRTILVYNYVMKQRTSISTTFELQFLRIIIRYTLSSVFVIKIISLCTDVSCPKSIKFNSEMLLPSKTFTAQIKADCFSILAWGYLVPFSKLELLLQFYRLGTKVICSRFEFHLWHFLTFILCISMPVRLWNFKDGGS